MTDAPERPGTPSDLARLEQALAELAGRIRTFEGEADHAGDPLRAHSAETLERLISGQSLKDAGADDAARRMALRHAMKDLAALMAVLTAQAERESSPIPALVRHIPHEEAGPGTSIAGRIRTMMAKD